MRLGPAALRAPIASPLLHARAHARAHASPTLKLRPDVAGSSKEILAYQQMKQREGNKRAAPPASGAQPKKKAARVKRSAPTSRPPSRP